MITILLILFTFSFVKFLLEENLLIILMTMEFLSISSFFIIISINLDSMSLTSSVMSFLTILISESVLSLCFFVNLMRFYKKESMISNSLLKF